MSNSCHHSTSNPLRYFLSCDHEQRVHLSAFENVVLLLTTTCSNHTSYIMKACAVLSLRHITKLYVDAVIQKREKWVFDLSIQVLLSDAASLFKEKRKKFYHLDRIRKGLRLINSKCQQLWIQEKKWGLHRNSSRNKTS